MYTSSVANAVLRLCVLNFAFHISADGSYRPMCSEQDEWSMRETACHLDVTSLHEDGFYHEFLRAPDEAKLDIVCKTYEKWLVCVKELYDVCDPGHEEGTVNLARTLVLNTCSERRENTLHNLPCLVSQSGEANPLFRGCSSLMDLQTHANVFDTCGVAREYIECEDRLLRSACGSSLADFTLALSVRSKFTQLDVDSTCSYIPLINYNGFSYTMHCSPEFPVRMRECYDTFQETKVALYHSMLAIIRATTAELDTWCSAYYEYERCMEPIETTCPQGVDTVYKTENEWHRLVRVADYLCGEAINDYKRFLPCYTRMMRHSSSFNLCRKVFDRYPTKYEAYKVKCSPTKTASKINMQKRDKLIECFSSFMRRDCGLNASVTIEPLIRMQYSFDFLPPCEKSSTESCPDAVTSSAHSHLITANYYTCRVVVCICLVITVFSALHSERREFLLMRFVTE